MPLGMLVVPGQAVEAAACSPSDGPRLSSAWRGGFASFAQRRRVPARGAAEPWQLLQGAGPATGPAASPFSGFAVSGPSAGTYGPIRSPYGAGVSRRRR